MTDLTAHKHVEEVQHRHCTTVIILSSFYTCYFMRLHIWSDLTLDRLVLLVVERRCVPSCVPVRRPHRHHCTTHITGACRYNKNKIFLWKVKPPRSAYKWSRLMALWPIDSDQFWRWFFFVLFFLYVLWDDGWALQWCCRATFNVCFVNVMRYGMHLILLIWNIVWRTDHGIKILKFFTALTWRDTYKYW